MDFSLGYGTGHAVQYWNCIQHAVVFFFRFLEVVHFFNGGYAKEVPLLSNLIHKRETEGLDLRAEPAM